jgi:hypothetical protein
MIFNLTPHDLSIVLADGAVHRIPKSGNVARVATSRAAGPDVDGIPTWITSFGDVEGLPAPWPDTIYVVSGKAVRRTRTDHTPEPTLGGDDMDENTTGAFVAMGIALAIFAVVIFTLPMPPKRRRH